MKIQLSSQFNSAKRVCKLTSDADHSVTDAYGLVVENFLGRCLPIGDSCHEHGHYSVAHVTWQYTRMFFASYEEGNFRMKRTSGVFLVKTDG